MRVVFFAAACASLVAFASTSSAQRTPAPSRPPFWADTVGESDVYPVGEAVPVYRAVLDLLYRDGNRRPSVIIMWDTAERRSSGPCPIARCIGTQWAHKSKIDTATVMAFARVSPKRPRIRDFGYPIPIVLISQNDVHRMMADGNALIANRPRQGNEGMMTGFWAELTRKYPGAWGVTILSKVGLNRRRDEALVNVHQWCGEDCRSIENIFLKKTRGRWHAVERIPSQVDIDQPSRVLRYVGPAGTTPAESELLTAGSGAPPEATARAAVYRAVLDSLYSFRGEHPRTIVLTDYFWAPFDSLSNRPAIDKSLAQKFAILRHARAPLDTRPSYRIPIVTLPMDSFPALKARGVALDRVTSTGFSPQDLGFTKRYPGAWGMLSMSRVAFNTDRSTALVYTSHICGEHCRTSDTWVLRRTGARWRIIERIPAFNERDLQVEPLRYLGVDADANAYRPRRVHGVVTDYTTGKPLPFLTINVQHVSNYSGTILSDPSLRTDSTGRYTLTNLPLNYAVSLIVPCPDAPHGAAIQSFGVMPGMDTTINFPVDFRNCEPIVEPPPQPSPLSGAEAFIGKDSARFVFPVSGAKTYDWDIPTKRAYAGYAQYMWGVQWNIPDSRVGNSPYLLWLIKRWQPGGPRSGTLQQLIAGVRLEPMIECTTCDGAVFADPETDYAKVFATVENGQLIFVVRGADAVRKIFPTVPTTVTFTERIQLPGPEGPEIVDASQEVLVNCRNSSESEEAKRHCDVKH